MKNLKNEIGMENNADDITVFEPTDNIDDIDFDDDGSGLKESRDNNE